MLGRAGIGGEYGGTSCTCGGSQTQRYSAPRPHALGSVALSSTCLGYRDTGFSVNRSCWLSVLENVSKRPRFAIINEAMEPIISCLWLQDADGHLILVSTSATAFWVKILRRERRSGRLAPTLP